MSLFISRFKSFPVFISPLNPAKKIPDLLFGTISNKKKNDLFPRDHFFPMYFP